MPSPNPPANATTCACASWSSVTCNPPDAWPCDPYFNKGTFWYCETGPGWKPPSELRDSPRLVSKERDFASTPRWSSPMVGRDPPDSAISLWRPAPLRLSGGKVIADLSAFQNEEVLAVRYAWPLGDSGDTCCPQKDVSDGLAPCIPGSCPLMSAKAQLPANPFFATVDSGSATACLQRHVKI